MSKSVEAVCKEFESIVKDVLYSASVALRAGVDSSFGTELRQR